ncbi:MAG TPA: Gfo/Idh/MocA family oxidoreductase [Anaerolineae bacterium]
MRDTTAKKNFAGHRSPVAGRFLEPIAVGIIGTGGMGTRHAHNLQRKVKGAKVAGLYDLDAGRMAQVAAECGPASVFHDPYELIADDRIDAVLIASPDETHADFVLACIQHDKPVLCEKPLATNAEDARIIIDAETAAGRQMVTVGFMRRFDSYHVAVKETVASGILGRPVLFRGIHRNAQAVPALPPRLIVTGSAVHDVDSARWLLQQEVEEVFACGRRIDPALREDAVDLLLLQLSLSGNCLATIEVYISARYGYEVTAEIIGEQGTAVTAQPVEAILRHQQHQSTLVHAEWLERFQDAYVAELEQWVQTLHGGPFIGANAWDGYMSLLVAEACLASLDSGQPEGVEIPTRPTLYGE